MAERDFAVASSALAEMAEAAAAGHPAPPSDLPDRLAAARRLDWRFLWPDPALGRVLVLGAAPPDLLDALRREASAVERRSGSWHEISGHPNLLAPADVLIVVLSASEMAVPALARRILAVVEAELRPGGRVYIEVSGWRAGAGPRRPMHPMAWVRSLTAGGLESVAAYAVWPDFERCLWLAPVAEPDAMRLAFGRGATDFPSRLAGAAARLALRVGLLPALLPEFCIVARRPEEGSA